MRHLTLATTFGFLLAMSTFAVAQDPAPTRPNRTDPNPPMPTTTQPETSPSQTPDMGGGNNQQASNESHGEKKLKGCIQSQGGSYVLEEKHGKTVALTGSSDLSSHVGHTVTVHGRYSSGTDNGSASSVSTGAGAGSSTTGASGAEQFVVSKIDMVSESCKMDKDKSSHDKSSDQSNPK